MPVHDLLGGPFGIVFLLTPRAATTVVTTCFDHERSLADLENEAASYTRAGFRLLKIEGGLRASRPMPSEWPPFATRSVPRTGILVDCNHAYYAPTAIRMGRILEQHGCLLFEEPVPPEDRSGYRQVREELDIAIAGGEAEYTRWGFRDLIAGGCVDVAQPDICVCGGFSEWQKIVALASAYGVPVLPHVWGSGIAVAAALHAIAALPPCRTPQTQSHSRTNRSSSSTAIPIRFGMSFSKAA